MLKDELDRGIDAGTTQPPRAAKADVVAAVAGDIHLDNVLESVAERAQQMVRARLVLILLEDRYALIVASTAGELPTDVIGSRMVADSAAWRGVMADQAPERVDDVGGRLGLSLSELGIEARTALLVPLAFRTRSFGIIAAFDREGGESRFTAEDEVALGNYGASAAIAVATARSVAEARLRESIQVSERERAHWARELHDETLQGLGALRVRLAASLRLDDAGLRDSVREALVQIEDEIENLRSLITELRPAALDELGLGAAIRSLADQRAASGLEVHLGLRLPGQDGLAASRLDRDVESAVYRVVQEALTNISKHAAADNVWIDVGQEDGAIAIGVRDDGSGFDMDASPRGFGMVGMRERVALQGGSLTIVSTPGVGTELRGRIPLHSPAPPSVSSIPRSSA